MIAKDSKSYPYLAIAQHYNISYAEVLRYAEVVCGYNVSEEWQYLVWMLELERKQ